MRRTLDRRSTKLVTRSETEGRTTATRQDIVGWLEEGKRQGATHVIVAVDTYDHDNYPIYVSPAQNAQAIYQQIIQGGNTQGVDEVYNLSKDLGPQLAQYRCKEF